MALCYIFFLLAETVTSDIGTTKQKQKKSTNQLPSIYKNVYIPDTKCYW